VPASRGMLPEGAPSELFDFLEGHPASTIEEAIAELKLERSTAYYALTRLSDLRLIRPSNRERPRRWRIAEKKNETSPSELEPPPRPRPGSEAVAPARADPFTHLLATSTDRTLRPSGVPFAVVDGRMRFGFRGCELQVLSIRGAVSKPEPNFWGRNSGRFGRGRSRGAPDDHPFSYVNRNRRMG
jgi:hypothetical protein